MRNTFLKGNSKSCSRRPFISCSNKVVNIITMAVNVQEQPHGTISLLDLPYEVITHICSDNALTLTDIFNLAMCHSKLNDYLFSEPNSSLWKTKYKQRYDDSNINEFQISIKHHNCWRSEIMLRMSLNKSVSQKIMQMPSKYLRFENVPYHAYPFGEELNSNNQNCQYYIYRSSLDFYTRMSSQGHKEYQDVLYMAFQFLRYTSKVFFSYKVQDFLNLPPAEQIIERGFHLLGRWWCPTVIIPYNNLSDDLDTITFVLYTILYFQQPLHPMFNNGCDFNSVIQNGKSNLDHDLYSKADSLKILECINDYIKQNDEIMCPCHQKVDCVLLRRALNCYHGPVFILCVLYESIARRLGVKVGLISTSVGTYLSWTPSWSGEINILKTTFSINIPINHTEEITIIRPDNRNLPLSSVADLLLAFSKFKGDLAFMSVDLYRESLYFHKYIKPQDTQLQPLFQEFQEEYEFCLCPLLRTPVNPLAPKHIDEKLSLYSNWEDIFPLVPKRRGTHNNPNYSIGMLVKTISNGTGYGEIRVKHGIIVGWSKISYTPWHDDIIYRILIKPHPRFDSIGYLNPDIEAVLDDNSGKIIRQQIWSDFIFKNAYKYFKYYDPTLCAFVPIDDLAKCYPDDFAHTVNCRRNL